MKLCLVCNFQFSDEQEFCPKDLSKLVPVGKDPLIGMLIHDRYRIESLVAKGSMGVIYKATQESIGRTVAVKVMHGYLVNDDESMKRYQKEAKAASRLNHPNITTVYDFGVLASGQPYIVMDLLTGKSLADVLQQRGQLTFGQTSMAFNQVCQALQEAHAHGIVHRDIKPENIVIDELPDGRNIHVKVVDFGIATFAAGDDDTIGKITKTGTVCGSPFYMSPEQCDGLKVDQRSDLYSLGVVLFECLTGKVPFESKDIYQVLSMHVKDPPPRLAKARPDIEFSPAVELVVARALAKDPAARFQNAREFWQAMAACISDKAGAGRQAGDAGRQSFQEIASYQAAAAETGGEQTVDPEAIRRKIKEAAGMLQERAEKAHAGQQAARRRRNQPVTAFDRVVSVAQLVVPPLLTLIMTAALFWVIGNQTMIHTLFSKNASGSGTTTVNRANVTDLVARNKLEEAKAVLDARKKEGNLSPEEQVDLDKICLKLARKEARSKHFKLAIAYLDQISEEGRDEDEVKVLIKKYRKLSR
jgi:tRNA A-37 threonylcarbamoyl transferase component Bud32